ncbi:thioredoxin family protein [Paenibacillus yanchengensis]|uniref:Thioredoxin family protein n=1 Tax=Paenibacillus yanchengensis TaxID=2035833 RepID=A0ABW4YIX0_9BACL
MTINLALKLGTGKSPQQFIDGMSKNQEQFLQWQQRFAWSSADDQQFFEALQSRADLHCYILMADWCGDVVRNIPVVFQLMETSAIPVEVLVMEEHLETMDQFLTLGGRSIPVVIFTNTAGDVLGKWGPRPAYIQEPMVAFKQNNPDREAADYATNLTETRAEIMRRYGEDTAYQADIVREIRSLLVTI